MNDLKNRKVLITGGAGFVGSFVAERLLSEGVLGLTIMDNLIRGTKYNIKDITPYKKVRFIEGDIRDKELLDRAIRDNDYCIHLAALRITHCAGDPQEAVEVMLQGTYNVIAACLSHKIKKIVFASSASVYGLADDFPTKESQHPYNNTTLYGAVKVSGELMLRAFYHMSGLDYVALRYFNVYGPRMDTCGKYTEVLIRWYNLVKNNAEPLIYGDGNQTMDFVYVEDVARATILALKSEATDEVINIGSGKETSLKELCGLLIGAMGGKVRPKFVPILEERKKVEVLRRCADISKAATMIGFRPEVPLAEGLKKLALWLKEQEENIHQKI